MQINVSTEITEEDPIPSPLVERDLWEQAFEPFDGEHYAALRLGFNFAMLRNHAGLHHAAPGGSSARQSRLVRSSDRGESSCVTHASLAHHSCWQEARNLSESPGASQVPPTAPTVLACSAR